MVHGVPVTERKSERERVTCLCVCLCVFVRGVRARVRVFLTAGRVAGGREETLIECGAAGAGGGGGGRTLARGRGGT